MNKLEMFSEKLGKTITIIPEEKCLDVMGPKKVSISWKDRRLLNQQWKEQAIALFQ